MKRPSALLIRTGLILCAALFVAGAPAADDSLPVGYSAMNGIDENGAPVLLPYTFATQAGGLAYVSVKYGRLLEDYQLAPSSNSTGVMITKRNWLAVKEGERDPYNDITTSFSFLPDENYAEYFFHTSSGMITQKIYLDSVPGGMKVVDKDAKILRGKDNFGKTCSMVVFSPDTAKSTVKVVLHGNGYYSLGGLGIRFEIPLADQSNWEKKNPSDERETLSYNEKDGKLVRQFQVCAEAEYDPEIDDTVCRRYETIWHICQFN